MDNSRWIKADAAGVFIAAAFDRNRMDLDDEVDANARLIAQAPEATGLLRWAVAMVERPEDMWDEEGQPTEEVNRFAALARAVLKEIEGG